MDETFDTVDLSFPDIIKHINYAEVPYCLQGWMEKTAMFMGFYDAQDLYIINKDRNYSMPLAYFLVSLIILLLSLITMAR